MTSMTRSEFWDRHDAIVKRDAEGVAVAPAAAGYNKEEHQALHREYYSQWARKIGPLPTDLLRRCRKALEAGDMHLNSPFTSLMEWDAMQSRTKGVFRESDGVWSLSFNICVLKEAARLQIEQSMKGERNEQAGKTGESIPVRCG